MSHIDEIKGEWLEWIKKAVKLRGSVCFEVTKTPSEHSDNSCYLQIGKTARKSLSWTPAFTEAEQCIERNDSVEEVGEAPEGDWC